MAELLNRCLYKDCARCFKTQDELIRHVEYVHIDFDPKVIEELEAQRPFAVPMSYILRYTPEKLPPPRKPVAEIIVIKQEKELDVYDPEIANNIKDEPDFNLYNEIDDYNNNVSTINMKKPSWLIEESPPIKKEVETDSVKSSEKKFSCPVDGCLKKYKNPNGMKYHIQNCHDGQGKPIKPKKEFKCSCGREYKTIRGLQSHAAVHKEVVPDPVIPPPPPPLPQTIDLYHSRPNYPALMPRQNFVMRSTHQQLHHHHHMHHQHPMGYPDPHPDYPHPHQQYYMQQQQPVVNRVFPLMYGGYGANEYTQGYKRPGILQIRRDIQPDYYKHGGS